MNVTWKKKVKEKKFQINQWLNDFMILEALGNVFLMDVLELPGVQKY